MGLFSRLPAGAKAVKPRLYDAIDRATSEYLSAPNLAQNMDVVATINSAVDPTYAANKTCKRICLRLRTRNQRVQYVALQLLENCVRSCGDAFHLELAKSDLLNEIARMGDRSVWCATEIQRLVLALVQEWAYEIKYPQFTALYNKLKQRGMPFDPRGARTEALMQPYPGLSPPPPGGYPQHPQNMQHGTPGTHMYDQQHQLHGAPPGQNQNGINRAPSRSGANLGPDLLRPGRSPQDLTADLEVARGTILLLAEVLDGVEAEGNWGAVKEEYCIEVASACESLKNRLAALLGAGITDEAVVAAALEVNDEAQKVLERRAALFDVAEGRRPPPPQSASVGGTRVTAATPPAAPSTTPSTAQPAPEVPSSSSSPPPVDAKTVATPGPMMDLLDLDWTPAAETSGPVVDPFLPPAPMAPPPMNNPFAPSAVPAVVPSVDGGSGKGQRENGVADESNPFLSDDAFASVSSSQGGPGAPESGVQQPSTTEGTVPSIPSAAAPSVPAPAAPAMSSGNPFASAALSGGGGGGGSFKRPPPVVIPGSNVSLPPGPYTAPPGYHTTGTPAFAPFTQQQPPLTTLGGAGPAAANPQGGGFPHQWGQQGAPTPTPLPTATPTYPPIYAPTPTPGYGAPRPSGDVFSNLIALAPKKEELPPPPKGSPMRRGGSETPKSSAGDIAANGGGSTPRSPLVQQAPQQAPPPAQQENGQQDAGLSAFDAFDALASGRS